MGSADLAETLDLPSLLPVFVVCDKRLEDEWADLSTPISLSLVCESGSGSKGKFGADLFSDDALEGRGISGSGDFEDKWADFPEPLAVLPFLWPAIGDLVEESVLLVSEVEGAIRGGVGLPAPPLAVLPGASGHIRGDSPASDRAISPSIVSASDSRIASTSMLRGSEQVSGEAATAIPNPGAFGVGASMAQMAWGRDGGFLYLVRRYGIFPDFGVTGCKIADFGKDFPCSRRRLPRRIDRDLRRFLIHAITLEIGAIPPLGIPSCAKTLRSIANRPTSPCSAKKGISENDPIFRISFPNAISPSGGKQS